MHDNSPRETSARLTDFLLSRYNTGEVNVDPAKFGLSDNDYSEVRKKALSMEGLQSDGMHVSFVTVKKLVGLPLLEDEVQVRTCHAFTIDGWCSAHVRSSLTTLSFTKCFALYCHHHRRPRHRPRHHYQDLIARISEDLATVKEQIQDEDPGQLPMHAVATGCFDSSVMRMSAMRRSDGRLSSIDDALSCRSGVDETVGEGILAHEFV